MKQNLQTYPRYEEDHYGWLQAMITLLRERRMDDLDVDNLIGDLEDMGNSNKNQLVNRLAVLIAHLLKWQFQPTHRSFGWKGTIKEQRMRLKKLLEENPGLKPLVGNILPDAFQYSLPQVFKDTGLDLESTLVHCPWTFEQCMDESFFPDTGGAGQKVL